ncbi:MAG: retroviral-like aspartic protease family protein [Defluviitaleaceae bacterium]|nr:retroviral-like aspartic protease family protein [Defluviitaleaceae bacterium]
MIKTAFRVQSTKLITTVMLKAHGKESVFPYNAVFDPGCTMTTISHRLFERLAYPLKDPANIRLIGINGESKGVSTIIDYFEIGGVNLGSVRVAVGEVHPNFENSIILGMNILLWYDFAVTHSTKTIALLERRFKNRDMSARFTMKNIMIANLAIDEITNEGLC